MQLSKVSDHRQSLENSSQFGFRKPFDTIFGFRILWIQKFPMIGLPTYFPQHTDVPQPGGSTCIMHPSTNPYALKLEYLSIHIDIVTSLVAEWVRLWCTNQC